MEHTGGAKTQGADKCLEMCCVSNSHFHHKGSRRESSSFKKKNKTKQKNMAEPESEISPNKLNEFHCLHFDNLRDSIAVEFR